MKLKDAQKLGIPFSDIVEVVIPAGGQSLGTITNQDNREFIITDIINTSFKNSDRSPTNAFTFKMEDKGIGYNFSYAPIPAFCLGSGKLPTRLRVPYSLKGTAELGFTFENFSGSAITVQIVVRGYKIASNVIDSELRKSLSVGKLFWDVFKISLAANQTTKSIINNQDMKDILFDEMIADAYTASLVESVAYKLGMCDSASKEMLTQNFISGSSIGNGEFPTQLDVPFRLRGKNQFECEASNSLSESLTVYLVLKGTKLSK